MGIREFHFYDDTFAVDRARVLDICREIRKRNLQICWHARTRVDSVDFELLKAMKEAGCRSVHYGIESATPRILKILRKDISLKEAEEVVSATRALGIQTLVYFILGNPTETRDEIHRSIEYAIKLKPDFAHFSVLIPFPATEIYDRGVESGVLPGDYWREFAAHPDKNFKTPLWEEILREEDIIALHRAAYRRFYFRPAYVLQRLRSARSARGIIDLSRRAFELARSL